MPPRALLSRIAGTPPTGEVESIVAHLRALLNTRRGDAVTVPGFGLVGLADMAHDPGAAREVAGAVRAAILEYEPRLKNATVRHVPDGGLVLRFEIVGELGGAGSRKVRIATAFRPGGRVDVGG
jgi:type VI secretion system protein